ncbi:MAG: MFS transporter, DHA1 family, tetracycline resistance protein [Alphaproteobacteria bacterium]|nr:MAG: MFS transporter DHA1 family tetracycline resistance protein [Caulobacteraceae bacterium]TPW04021.1 MAG: MFS transporter, DHA1 family, tetracycline resistance protein [Alphaproteobacteria bacterium]
MTAAAPRPHALVFICLTVLIDTIGFGIVMPVLPDLLMKVGAVSLNEATRIGGYLLIVYGVLQFFCGPVLGNLSDRFGRRPVLLLSLVAFGIDYLLMAFAPTIAWLFVGRAVAGVAGAVYGPAGAYIADISTPEKRAQSFGMMGAMFGIGFIVGPALGGLIATFGLRAPFIAAGLLALANAAYGYFALPESLAPENRRLFSLARANPFGAFRTFLKHPGVLALIGVMFGWQLAHQVYPATWGFFAKARFDWSPRDIGLSLAYVGMTMAVVQGLLVGRIVKRIGEARAAMLGIATGTAAFIANAFATEVWMVYAAMTLGALQGLAYASMQALLSQRVPPDSQGELQGGLASMVSVAAIIGPLVMTQTLANHAEPGGGAYFPGAAFLLAGGIGVICLAALAFITPPRAIRTAPET